MRIVIASLACLLLACRADELVVTNDECLHDVDIAPSPALIAVGDSLRVVARAHPCLRAQRPFSWSAIDSSIARVRALDDSAALVTGRTAGTTPLVVRAANGPLGLRPITVVP